MTTIHLTPPPKLNLTLLDNYTPVAKPAVRSLDKRVVGVSGYCTRHAPCIHFASLILHCHIRMHACMHTYIHIYMHACIHTYIHTCMYPFRVLDFALPRMKTKFEKKNEKSKNQNSKLKLKSKWTSKWKGEPKKKNEQHDVKKGVSSRDTRRVCLYSSLS